MPSASSTVPEEEEPEVPARAPVVQDAEQASVPVPAPEAGRPVPEARTPQTPG